MDLTTIAHLTGVPGLEGAVAFIKPTAAHLMDVKIHKQQCSEMRRRCLRLMVGLADASEGLEGTRILEIADEIEMIMQRVARKLREWASMNLLRSFLAQGEIKDGIDSINRDIDEVVTRFSISTNLEIAGGQIRSKSIQERDKAELRELLYQIITRSQDEMKFLLNTQTSLGIHPVEEVMESIQIELMDPSLDRMEVGVFRASLWELHLKTAKLPPLTDLTGQVDIGPLEARGGSNDVFLGRWLDKETVALRHQRNIANSPDDQQDFQREVSLWRRLSHENVNPPYGVVYQGNYLYSVSVWMENGPVSDYTEKNPTVDRLRLLTDAAMGLEYLHQRKIVHGDVRGANLLISKNGTARLSEFGVSKFLEDSGRGANSANFRWCAPELVRETGPISTYSDIWSFGMLCLEVLSGQPPYADTSLDIAVVRKVDQGKLPDHPGFIATQNGLSKKIWNLMLKCWNLEPEARPSITEVKNDLLNIGGLMGIPQESDPAEEIQATTSRVLGIFSKQSRKTADSAKTGTPSLSRRCGVHIDRRSTSAYTASTQANASSVPRLSSLPTLPSTHFPDRKEFTKSQEAVIDPRKIVYLNETKLVVWGTLEGFVQYLITRSTSGKDKEFRDVLFTACADFTTPEDLFRVLSRRFFEVPSDGTQETEDRAVLQYSIFLVIMYWVSNRNLPVDQQLMRQIKSFCEMAIQVNTPITMRHKARDLLDLIETRCNENACIPPLSPGCVKLSASQISPEHLAIALALLEGDIYKTMVPADYIAHLRRHPGYNNMQALYMANNKIAYWVKESILDEERATERMAVLEFFIHTANHCLKRRNFSSLMAIASALYSAPIERLKLTKGRLEPELKKRLEFFKSIIDPSSNHRGYRDALNNTATLQERDQCIPWLAIHLKELHLVLKRFPATVEVEGRPMINLERYIQFMDRIREVAYYKPPNLEPFRSAGYLDYLQSQLQSVKLAPDSDFWMMTKSKIIEECGIRTQSQGREHSDIHTRLPRNKQLLQRGFT